jgi:hypothetical protein
MCCRVESAFRQRCVPRGRYKFPKLRVGHLVSIDPEAVYAHDVVKRSSGRWRSEPITKLPPRMNTIPAVSPFSAGKPE